MISTLQGAWCETLLGTEPSRNSCPPVMPLLPKRIRTASPAVSGPSVPTTIDLNTRSPLVANERARSYASVIDLHCHILPGVDDGPPTLEETLALARTQVAAGVERVLATPHVTWDIP